MIKNGQKKWKRERRTRIENAFQGMIGVTIERGEKYGNA